MRIWSNHDIFVADIIAQGGLAQVSLQTGFLLSTLTAWFEGTRVPHWISRAGIAVALGYAPNRY